MSVSAQDASVRLMTLDPGHFHAALIQKEMYPGVDPTVHVFAPLGPDLLLHLGRVAAFNARAERPTSWRLEVHAGPDFVERMLREKPGNVVVLSGRNRGKIDRILASVEAGLNVLADKPWLIAAADFPKLERALDGRARRSGLVAYDVMTERSEITTILQRELSQDPQVAGDDRARARPSEPALEMDERPPHPEARGRRAATCGPPGSSTPTSRARPSRTSPPTSWTSCRSCSSPGRPIDTGRRSAAVGAALADAAARDAAAARDRARRSSPPALAGKMKDDRLDYFANGEASFTVRGVHARVKVLWNYEAPAGGGDTHVARRAREPVAGRGAAGRRAAVAARALRRAEPAGGRRGDPGGARAAASRRSRRPAPASRCSTRATRLRVVVPDRYRVGHEAHFAEVTRALPRLPEGPGDASRRGRRPTCWPSTA